MRIVKTIGSLSVLFLMILGMSISSSSQIAIGVSVSIAPPELPVYEQPPCPGDDYIWTPGYWAYGDGDYYWVPGTWCLRRSLASYGHPVIGRGATRDISLHPVIGVRWSAFTAALITVMDILAMGMKAGDGTTGVSSTTAR